MVHAGAGLAQIGEADAKLQQFRKFLRRITAQRDAGLMQRAPEAIAGMRVVMADVADRVLAAVPTKTRRR